MTEHASRVFHSTDAGKTWTVSDAPLIAGLNKGVFAIAVLDAHHLAIVGGDYDHPQMVTHRPRNVQLSEGSEGDSGESRVQDASLSVLSDLTSLAFLVVSAIIETFSEAIPRSHAMPGLRQRKS